MNDLYLFAFLLSLLAGSAIFIGALLASYEKLLPKYLEKELRHTVTSMGGGALLAAIALVLVPEGIKDQHIFTAIVSFIAGGLAVMKLDRYFAKKKTTASQLVAMMLDFIPETIVIGAVITKDFKQALLLSLIIFIQNLPESFVAYREIKLSKGFGGKKILLFFFIIAMSGPLYVYVGTALLADQNTILAILMTFCAGGILYLIFNDIAPKAKLQNHSWPPMGALFGFMVGMIGFKLIQ